MTTTIKTPATASPTSIQRYLAKLAWWLDARGHVTSLAQPTAEPKPVSTTEQRLPVLIVARDGYQERWETFSIRSARELKRVLALRDQGEPVQHYLGKIQNGQRQVLTVRWHAAVLPAIQSAYVAFPESLIVAAGVGAGLTHSQQRGSHYFLLKQSTGQWQSLPASSLVATPERALLALGGAANTPQQALATAEWNLTLIRGLQQVGWSAWQQSFQNRLRNSGAQDQFPWRTALLSGATLLGLYAFISTAYLLISTATAQSSLAAINADLDAALTAQAAVNQAQQQLDNLAQHQSNVAAVDQFWQTIADTQALSIQLNNAVSDYASVTLAAEGQGATAVLTQLLQRSYVASADFTAAVRSQNNGLERFTIKLQFAPEPEPTSVQTNTQVEP